MEEKNSGNEKYILSSVDSALSVLSCFFNHEELSASDIAREMEINRSTAFRFLVTLENRGYLTKTPNSKYRLGVKIFSLGQLAHNRMALVSLVRPYLLKMTAATNETSHLVIMDDASHVIFADKAVGNSLLKMDSALGLRTLAHLTGSGKAILAFQPDRIVNQYLRVAQFEQKTEHSIKDTRELLERLDQVRIQGYSEDMEESELGLSCVAMPIIDLSGHAIAAVSISGPTTRVKAHWEQLLTVLREAIGGISQALL